MIRLTLISLFFVFMISPALADFATGLTAMKDKKYAVALDEFTPLAKRGHSKAQYQLGLLYRFGWGVKQDLVQAIHWYKRAADMGHAVASNNAGHMYRVGLGVKRNYKEAAKYFTKALDQLPLARNNLGVMHRYGLGVRKSNAEAVRLFRWGRTPNSTRK